MTYFELLSTEKEYYSKLTADERVIYRANQEQLAAISTWNDYYVRSFVEVAQLLNELHRIHERYNTALDYMFKLPNATEEQQKIYNDLYEDIQHIFSMNIAIGSFSAVFSLSCMDECEQLYGYLAFMKMSCFNRLIDNFDVEVLIETLVSHECY